MSKKNAAALTDDPPLDPANIGPGPDDIADDAAAAEQAAAEQATAEQAAAEQAAADDPLAPGKNPTLGEIMEEEARRAAAEA